MKQETLNLIANIDENTVILPKSEGGAFEMYQMDTITDLRKVSRNFMRTEKILESIDAKTSAASETVAGIVTEARIKEISKALDPIQATELVAGVVKIATQTEVDAGTDDTKIVTSKKLKALFAGSNVNFGVNGYEKLPNGLIRQWGWSAIPAIPSGIGSSVEQTINFPITFPNSCLSVNITGTADSGDDGLEALNSAAYRDRNKVIVRSYRMVGTYNGTPGSVCWQAIGY